MLCFVMGRCSRAEKTTMMRILFTGSFWFSNYRYSSKKNIRENTLILTQVIKSVFAINLLRDFIIAGILIWYDAMRRQVKTTTQKK